jgi:Transposase and inactivated derivatives, IS30 family
MNDQKKAIIWELWIEGSPMIDISRAIDKPHATVFSYLRYHGGIQPHPRIRSPITLSLVEREEISRGLSANHSVRKIASLLERNSSVISREVNRNEGVSKYRATEADTTAWKRAKRPKPCLLSENIKLKEIVTGKLSQNWSPEQISGWLKLAYPDNESLRVSHETIYKSLFIQTRGLFLKKMRSHLRTKRKFRRSKKHQTAPRGKIVDGVSISERPASIEDRAVPGHWEGGLILGSKNSYIATVFEPQTRFTVLVKVNGKDTESAVNNLSEQMSNFPKLLKQSLIWDRETKLANHKNFTIATGMEVYFCDPENP